MNEPEVDDNHFPGAHFKSPTLQDIAERAGVSVSTVSRVLNGSSSVQTSTRTVVERILRTSGYQRRTTSVRKRYMAGTVGLIVPDIANPYFTLLIKGTENTLKLFQMNVVLADSGNDPELQERAIDNLVQSGVSGLLVVPARASEVTIVNELAQQSFPVVFVDRLPKQAHDLSSVTADNKTGSYHAARYLTSLGHRDILYLGGVTDSSTEVARKEGFHQAIAEQDLNVDHLVHAIGNYGWESARREVSHLIEKGAKFSAVFATNDIMALGAMQALQEHKLKVPDDVSVIGYDDIPFSQIVSLTTVAQHPHEMAARAARLLVDIIEKRVNAPQTHVLMPSLIIRASCRRR